MSNAKAIVQRLTSNGFTLAKPTHCGLPDVVSFQTAEPAARSAEGG